MDISESEDLVAIGVIPGGHGVQVEAPRQDLRDVPQDSAHEGEVVRVDGLELRHVVVLLRLNLGGRVLLVH